MGNEDWQYPRCPCQSSPSSTLSAYGGRTRKGLADALSGSGLKLVEDLQVLTIVTANGQFQIQASLYSPLLLIVFARTHFRPPNCATQMFLQWPPPPSESSRQRWHGNSNTITGIVEGSSSVTGIHEGSHSPWQRRTGCSAAPRHPQLAPPPRRTVAHAARRHWPGPASDKQ